MRIRARYPVHRFAVAVAQVFALLQVVQAFVDGREGAYQVRGQRIVKIQREGVFEAASKLKREKNSRGPLKNGEQVTIKAKNRVWRAVVVNVKPEAPPKPKKRKTAAAVMATSDVVQASIPPHEGDPVTQPSTTTPSTHTPVTQQSTTTPSTHTPVAQPSTTIPSTHTPTHNYPTTPPSHLY